MILASKKYCISRVQVFRSISGLSEKLFVMVLIVFKLERMKSLVFLCIHSFPIKVDAVMDPHPVYDFDTVKSIHIVLVRLPRERLQIWHIMAYS